MALVGGSPLAIALCLMKREITTKSRCTPGTASSVQPKIAPVDGEFGFHATLQFLEWYRRFVSPLFQKRAEGIRCLAIAAKEFETLLDHRAEAAVAAFGDEAAGEGILLVGQGDGGFDGRLQALSGATE